MMQRGTVSQAVLPFLGAQTAHLAAAVLALGGNKGGGGGSSVAVSTRGSRSGSIAGGGGGGGLLEPGTDSSAGRISSTPEQARAAALSRRPQRVAVLVSTAARTVVLRVMLSEPSPSQEVRKREDGLKRTGSAAGAVVGMFASLTGSSRGSASSDGVAAEGRAGGGKGRDAGDLAVAAQVQGIPVGRRPRNEVAGACFAPPEAEAALAALVATA